MHISSGPKTPKCPPMHAPHVEWVTMAPAFKKISINPSDNAFIYISFEAGVIIILVLGDIFFPLSILAATLKSSILPFVQLPKKA